MMTRCCLPYLIVATSVALTTAACPTPDPGDPLPEEQSELCNSGRYGDLYAWDDGGFTPDVATVTPDGDGAELVLRYVLPFHPGDACLWVEVTTQDAQHQPIVVFDGPLFITDLRQAEIRVRLDEPVAALDGQERYFGVRLTDGLTVDNSASFFFLRRDASATLPAPTSAACEDAWRMDELDLSLGVVADDGSWRAFDAQHPAELLWGFQGASMVTPRVRIVGAQAAFESCYYVRLTNVLRDGSVQPGPSGMYKLAAVEGGDLLSGHFFDELDARAVGTTVTIEAVVMGVGERTERSFQVPVVDEE